jgi:hypothetical protein
MNIFRPSIQKMLKKRDWKGPIKALGNSNLQIRFETATVREN